MADLPIIQGQQVLPSEDSAFLVPIGTQTQGGIAAGNATAREGQRTSDFGQAMQERLQTNKSLEGYSQVLGEMGTLVEGDLLARAGSDADGVVQEFMSKSNESAQKLGLTGGALEKFNKHFLPFQAQQMRALASHEAQQAKAASVHAANATVQQEYRRAVANYPDVLLVGGAVASGIDAIGVVGMETGQSPQEIASTQTEFAGKTYTDVLGLMVQENPLNEEIGKMFAAGRKHMTPDQIQATSTLLAGENARYDMDVAVDDSFSAYTSGAMTATQAKAALMDELEPGHPAREPGRKMLNAMITQFNTDQERATNAKAQNDWETFVGLLEDSGDDSRTEPNIGEAMKIAMRQRKAMRNDMFTYLQNKADGVSQNFSDTDRIEELERMAGRDPIRFVNTPLQNERSRFKRSDYEDLLKLQEATRRGDVDEARGLKADATAGALQAMGLNETKDNKLSEPQRRQVEVFRRAVNREIEENRKSKGVDLVQTEVDEIVARLSIRVFTDEVTGFDFLPFGPGDAVDRFAFEFDTTPTQRADARSRLVREGNDTPSRLQIATEAQREAARADADASFSEPLDPRFSGANLPDVTFDRGSSFSQYASLALSKDSTLTDAEIQVMYRESIREGTLDEELKGGLVVK